MTEAEYTALRKKINHYDSEARLRFTQKSGWVVIPAEAIPTLPPNPTNAERSACEVYEFLRDRPDSYFCYIRESSKEVTTWTGDVIGNVQFGSSYRDNFGGWRVPVTVVAINGVKYHGTYYKSAGDYARLRAYKHQAA